MIDAELVMSTLQKLFAGKSKDRLTFTLVVCNVKGEYTGGDTWIFSELDKEDYMDMFNVICGNVVPDLETEGNA